MTGIGRGIWSGSGTRSIDGLILGETPGLEDDAVDFGPMPGLADGVDLSFTPGSVDGVDLSVAPGLTDRVDFELAPGLMEEVDFWPAFGVVCAAVEARFVPRPVQPLQSHPLEFPALSIRWIK